MIDLYFEASHLSVSLKLLTLKPYSIGLIFLPPLLYYSFFLHHALNVPVGDDFVVILKFLMDWDLANESISQKWSLLTQNFIDHRLVYTRLSALFVRSLLGKLDFRAVMLFGNITLLGIFWLLTRPLAAARYSRWYYVPIALLLFQPVAYEGNFWAIASTNYMPVCFLSMLCFYWLNKSQPAMQLLAIVAGIGATLTFANGLLVWPIGCLLLLLQKRKQPLIWWCIATVMAITLYFWNFSYNNQPGMVHNLTHRFVSVASAFFLMAGSSVGYADKNHPITFIDGFQLLTGFGVCCWVIYGIYKLTLEKSQLLPSKMEKSLPSGNIDYVAGFGLFLLASCALFAVGRSVDGYVVTESRYRHFSVILLAVCYVYVVRLATQPRRSVLFRVSFLLAFLFFLSSYVVYTPRLEAMQRKTKAGLYNWQLNKHWLIYREGGYYQSVADTLSNWVDQHARSWYQFPTYLTTSPLQTGISADSSIKIQHVKSPDTQTIRIDYAMPQPASGEPYFYLLSDKKIWLLEAYHPTSIRHLVSHGRYRTSCVQSNFAIQPKALRHVLPGNYQLGVVFFADNQPVRAVQKPAFRVQIQ